jgi:hypothetical protein
MTRAHAERDSRSPNDFLYGEEGALYLVSFIPSGISGGGSLMRLWFLP